MVISPNETLSAQTHTENQMLPKEQFNNLIREQVKRLMKSYKFKKKGLTFYRDVNDLCYVVNFQKSSGNHWGSLRFFINCAVLSRTIDNLLESDEMPIPKEWLCHYRLRIENLTDKDYQHYTFNIDDEQNDYDVNKYSLDPQWIAEQVMEDLQFAIPKLLEIQTTDELVDIMIKSNGDINTKALERYLLKTGQLDKFQIHYDGLYQSLGNDERWERIQRGVDELKEELLGFETEKNDDKVYIE